MASIVNPNNPALQYSNTSGFFFVAGTYGTWPGG